MTDYILIDYKSPLGIIEITGTDEAIYDISFTDKKEQDHPLHIGTPNVLRDCYEQLDEYFQGTRSEFSVPYVYKGTVFQEEVWHALTTIPYGETGSSGDIARYVKREKAVRAVG